jgi:hypothetical protein
MAESANLLVLVKISGSLFESPDQMHLPQPLDGFGSINDRFRSGLYLGHDLLSLLVLAARLCGRTRDPHRGVCLTAKIDQFNGFGKNMLFASLFLSCRPLPSTRVNLG